jgi:isopenicillin N synthase-like dioxygenase
MRARVGPEVAWSFLVNQPNKWPKNLPQFRNVLLPFLSECGDLADEVLAALEEALDMAEPLLTQNHVKRNYTMRLLHYPAVQSAVERRANSVWRTY